MSSKRNVELRCTEASDVQSRSPVQPAGPAPPSQEDTVVKDPSRGGAPPPGMADSRVPGYAAGSLSSLRISQLPARPLRISIVSSEFLGPFRNGGVGTAYTKLAELLCEAGHDVTLLYTNGRFTVAEPIEHWVADFRKRGIALVPLPDSPVQLCSASPNTSVSHRVYLWLRDNDRFDMGAVGLSTKG